MKTYAAALGASVKWITVGAYVVLLSVAFLAFYLRFAVKAPLLAFWVTAGTTTVISIASLGFRIHGYDLGPDELVIRYGFWRRVIRLGDVLSVSSGNGVINRSLRICASGGLWSFLGLFHHGELGRFRAYVSDLSKVVMLVTSAGRVLVSPSEPEQFVRDITAHSPNLA